MSINKDVVMQKFQRFGGAMFTPVLLFGVFGMLVALSILVKNPLLFGAIADKGTWWYNLWYVIEQGAWTVFAQLPLLFVIGLPIGLAKSNNARCCMEAFVVYCVFNYFVQAMLSIMDFGVDIHKVGAGTGLTTIANITTLDTGMLGAIFIASIVVYLHNRFFDVDLPDYLGIFKGSALVVTIGFFLMLPIAYIFCLVWPMVQHGIASMQNYLISAGILGVWLYTFLERILIPTGLHHFIYMPFIFGPAVVDNGIQAYWLAHIQDYAQSTKNLMELFPQGGFALHGMSKIFGCTGIALAMYSTARPERKKRVAALLIPATLTAILCGITEPLEFTFLFVAPILFLIHAILAATLAATVYYFGVTGNFGGGLIDWLFQNWIPLYQNHGNTYVTQVLIGVIFTGIWYLVFRFLIIKLNLKTPGRGDDVQGDKLYTKADYKAKVSGDKRDLQAAAYLELLGGRNNILDVTNCATRLRVTVRNGDLVKDTADFVGAGAHGLVKNGNAIQVIVGLSVSQVRERFEKLLMQPDELNGDCNKDEPELVAFAQGRVIPIDEVADSAFASRALGDGVAIIPSGKFITAPGDGEVIMVMEATKHAIGLKLNTGMEVLIHIGIDTVKLNGKFFNLLVNNGTKVKAGDKLVEIDLAEITKAGYDPTVIMVVTNYNEFNKLAFTKDLKDIKVEAGKSVLVAY